MGTSQSKETKHKVGDYVYLLGYGESTFSNRGCVTHKIVGERVLPEDWTKHYEHRNPSRLRSKYGGGERNNPRGRWYYKHISGSSQFEWPGENKVDIRPAERVNSSSDEYSNLYTTLPLPQPRYHTPWSVEERKEYGLVKFDEFTPSKWVLSDLLMIPNYPARRRPFNCDDAAKVARYYEDLRLRVDGDAVEGSDGDCGSDIDGGCSSDSDDGTVDDWDGLSPRRKPHLSEKDLAISLGHAEVQGNPLSNDPVNSQGVELFIGEELEDVPLEDTKKCSKIQTAGKSPRRRGRVAQKTAPKGALFSGAPLRKRELRYK